MPAAGVTAFIGLGANLGDPGSTLRAVNDELAALERSAWVACSPLYRSAPVDAEGPDYFNCVVQLTTLLGAHELLEALQRIELRHGRERPYQNAPRTLDLDLLLYGDLVLDTPTLRLPHPRLHQRAFALVPLADLAPSIVIPGLGPIQQWLPMVANQRLQRLPA